MADNEVEMADASPHDANEPESPKPLQSIEADVKEEEEGEEEAAVSEGEDGDASGRPVSSKLYKALKNISDLLTNYKVTVKHRKTEEWDQSTLAQDTRLMVYREHFPSILFRRLPNKRNLPDYYEVIKEPSAISTLKKKIQRKQYTGIPEFVRDFALIVHNAQTYNRPNSGPVRDVLLLDTLFKEELQKLIDAGLVPQEQTAFPDLGEIPYATPEPDPVEEDDEEVDEDDEEDDDEDSDDDRRKKRARRGRLSISGKKQDREDEEGDDNDADKANDAEQKRRGRPPKVDTPMEARIKAILKGLRKYKNEEGHSLIFDFEKLPDKAEHPAYYLAIQNPVALDLIKRKAKRKKYNLLEEFMQDIETMFNNAMLYNEDGSPIHNNAKELLDEARKLAQAEKEKPDSEYLMQDGRLPLPFIEYNGKMWKIGDWIHIQNPNDVTKPIVAQIYRTWQDPDQRKWINACWYYRPEQTVHQYEKHFYPKEVVKTGQYRDHPIEEVIDKCFVMFFTRYGKGRPRDLDPTTEVYVCDSRYNEEKFKFNKIKTWASCLPDEVRDKDYEMDLYDVPKKVKKVSSPLINMLKGTPDEDGSIPQPTWANPNAPPVLGAVHKKPRDENQSPPPEPTPPPPPTPPPAVHVPLPQTVQHQQSRASLDRQASNASAMTGQTPRPSSSMTPQTSGYQTATPYGAGQYNRQAHNAAQNVYANATSQNNVPQAGGQYTPQQPHSAAPGLTAAHPVAYAGGILPQSYQRSGMPSYQAQQYPQAYGTHPDQGLRTKEVYILPDNANEAIPKEIRDLYPQDECGRVLFFARPPTDTRHIIEGKTGQEKGKPLSHSDKFMKAKIERMQAQVLAKRKRESGEINIRKSGPAQAADQGAIFEMATTKALTALNEHLEKGLFDLYKAQHGKDWTKYMKTDLDYNEALKKLAAKDKENEPAPSTDSSRLLTSAEERYKADRAEVIKNGFAKDFWTGLYLDDIDPRLPPFN